MSDNRQPDKLVTDKSSKGKLPSRGLIYWVQEHSQFDIGERIDRAETRLAELEAENARAMDLVRYARSYLFDEKAISQEEYAALVADSESGKRVARLESYDKMRVALADMQALVTKKDVGAYFISGGRQYRFNQCDQEDLAAFMTALLAARRSK